MYADDPPRTHSTFADQLISVPLRTEFPLAPLGGDPLLGTLGANAGLKLVTYKSTRKCGGS